MQFLGAQADIDAVVFKGTTGPYFQLAPRDVQKGEPVQLLSHPQAYDGELMLQAGSDPTIDSGIVSQISETGTHAAATFTGELLGCCDRLSVFQS